VDGSKLISGTHNELRWAAHPLSGVQGVFSALSTNTRKIGKLCRSIGKIPNLGTAGKTDLSQKNLAWVLTLVNP
jgi:hypothetical protein